MAISLVETTGTKPTRLCFQDLVGWDPQTNSHGLQSVRPEPTTPSVQNTPKQTAPKHRGLLGMGKCNERMQKPIVSYIHAEISLAVGERLILRGHSLGMGTGLEERDWRWRK